MEKKYVPLYFVFIFMFSIPYGLHFVSNYCKCHIVTYMDFKIDFCLGYSSIYAIGWYYKS
jgi:hypothetical protein